MPLTTLLMSPFCFCLLLGFCHKWNEGRGASLVKSLARSYNVHSSCIQEKWEWKHVLNQADGWLLHLYQLFWCLLQTMDKECFVQLFSVCFVEFMSKVFLKFWVEQSHLMDWNEKNGGTFPQPFSQESVWMVVDDRKQKPLKSSSSTSSVLYLLCLRRGGNVLPLEFWRTLVRSRFTISGCERECVQRLMRRKYSDYSFSLWGGERYSSLP